MFAHSLMLSWKCVLSPSRLSCWPHACTPSNLYTPSPLTTTTTTTLQVEYETLPGWKCDISKVRRWEDLPQAARDYVIRIEEHVGVYCKWIGVGPGRDAIVVKPKKGKC